MKLGYIQHFPANTSVVLPASDHHCDRCGQKHFEESDRHKFLVGVIHINGTRTHANDEQYLVALCSLCHNELGEPMNVVIKETGLFIQCKKQPGMIPFPRALAQKK